MSKYSDFKEWLTSAAVKTDEEKVAIFESILLPDGSAVEMHAELEAGEAIENELFDACMCIAYADHVTAKLQAEIDKIKQQNAELLAEIKALKSGDVYTPCSHKFNANLDGVLSCTNCRVPFFEQQERGES